MVINKMMIIVDKPLLQIKDLRKGLKLKTPVFTSWSTSSGKSNKVKKKKTEQAKTKDDSSKYMQLYLLRVIFGFWFSKIATN